MPDTGKSLALACCGDVVLSSGKSAALQLLEESDQLLKLLRLRDVSLHLILKKTSLKRQSLLEVLLDLFDQREN